MNREAFEIELIKRGFKHVRDGFWTHVKIEIEVASGAKCYPAMLKDIDRVLEIEQLKEDFKK